MSQPRLRFQCDAETFHAFMALLRCYERFVIEEDIARGALSLCIPLAGHIASEWPVVEIKAEGNTHE